MWLSLREVINQLFNKFRTGFSQIAYFGVILDEVDDEDDTKYISVKTSYWEKEKNLKFWKFKTKHVFLFTCQLLCIIGCRLIRCTITGWKLKNAKFLNVKFFSYDPTLPNFTLWNKLETVKVGPTKFGNKFSKSECFDISVDGEDKGKDENK